MRKFMKKSILEIFQTMYEAHNNIKQFIEKKNFENANIILGDCQNTAIQIGEAIESSEGEGFVTVSYLEEYCEAVYEVSSSILDNYNGNKAQKVLDKLLIKAENSVKNDIKVRLEIVFCPYKASMWDSLESVWKAADEDHDCDAYVVPIPYYDRNPDHSFGEFHYEGGDYPDYVPITHYEAYNFEARRPDVVYIHNPYDECNYVTSVDPRFYSKELKKYTDELVYIPYFVLAEPNPDDTNSVEGVAHFAITPGVLNADKVIVQSEVMKQTYIKALLSKLGDTAENRNILEKKILGTGSPKFDKIVATSKNDIDIPDEWLKIIKKPDGTWKKVIFYNTGITALLLGGEAWIRKIQASMTVFKEVSKDIAILWRPHPLIETTMKSMRPDILENFITLKNTCIKEKWGIIDQSSDLTRAITLSDAFYGDGSSVVELFKKINKPIANTMFVYSGEKNSYPAFGCIVSNNNFLYASCKYNNALVRIDKLDGKSTIVAYFEENDKLDLYLAAIIFKEKIYWIPMNARRIAVYDIISNKLSYIDLPKAINEKSSQKFRSALIYNNKIFMFGYTIPYICTIDCDSKTVDAISLCEELKKSRVYFGLSSIIRNEFAYVPLYGFNKVMKLNLSDSSYKIFDVCTKSDSIGFTSIINDGCNFRLFNRIDEEFVWNEKDNVVSTKKNQINLCENKAYKSIINYNKYTIRIPFFWPHIIVEKNNAFSFDIDLSKNVNNRVEQDEYAFLCVCDYDNEILFQTNYDLKLYKMNKADLSLVTMNSQEINCEVKYMFEYLLKKIHETN